MIDLEILLEKFAFKLFVNINKKTVLYKEVYDGNLSKALRYLS